MGAEQSNSQNSNKKTFTKDEVEKIMEKQRQHYENKHQELLKVVNEPQDKNNKSGPPHTQQYSGEEVLNIIEKQRRLFANKLKVQPPRGAVLNDANDTARNVERQRTPYSFSQNDLQIGVAQPTSTSLYPNLKSPSERNMYSGTTTSNINQGSSQTHAASGVTYNVNSATATTPTAPPLNVNAAFLNVNTTKGATQNVNAATGATHNANATTGVIPKVNAAKGATINVNAATGATHNVCAATAATHNANAATNATRSPTAATGASHNANATTGVIPKVNAAKGATINVNAATGAIPKNPARNRNSKQQLSEDNELKCRTCAQMFTATVYQCRNGHSSCRKCQERHALCGVCGIPISDVRNRALEVFIAEMIVCCPNYENGCCLHFKIAELEEHSRECPYKELECPLSTFPQLCQWRGKLHQLSLHFDKMHQDNRRYNVDTEQELFIRKADSHVMQLVQIGTFNFLFQIKESALHRMIYMTVQMVGTAHSANKWTYEIQIYNKRQPRRKYQYTHNCQSNSTPLKDVCDAAMCAAIPISYAETFLNEGRVLFKFYIKKAPEKRPRGGATSRC